MSLHVAGAAHDPSSHVSSPQHWSDEVQVSPAFRHTGGGGGAVPHVKPSHTSPLQQSEPDTQSAPAMPHAAAQTLPVQTSAPQQSRLLEQVAPASRHAPPQVPPVHSSEPQHWRLEVHVAPVSRHALHVNVEKSQLSPVQHAGSVGPPQTAEAMPHEAGRVQRPLMHVAPARQSNESVHDAPSACAAHTPERHRVWPQQSALVVHEPSTR